MRCFFCKGEMVDGFTTNVTDLGTSVSIVRNVPCHKCSQCGETSFSLDVAERLEEIVDSLREIVTEITVIQYSDTAA
jgi:YgiT-type zinc finger domain-containing protein